MTTMTEYPPDDLGEYAIIGDPLDIKLTIDTDEDITTWTWAAEVRSYPGAPVTAAFTISADPDVTNGLILHLDGTDTAKMRDGYGCTLVRTDVIDGVSWWSVDRFRMKHRWTLWP